MEFDKSRCYSAINADELKPGDKVVVADNLADLKKFVRKNDVHEIEDILSDCVNERFGVCGMANYALAYLVERCENCTNCVHREGERCKPNVSPINCCPCYDREVKQSYIEPKAETPELISLGNGQYVERKHTDYNHCEEARKAYACAMTNVCPNKHYRPFANTDELIKVWDAKYRYAYGLERIDRGLDMPHIWVRRKKANSKGQLITEFGDELHVSMGKEGYNMFDLFLLFTFLDGSPCGVEA